MRIARWIPRILIALVCLVVLAHGVLLDRFDARWLEGLDTLLGYQCHRIEGRTLVVMGAPMSVCSRCAGLYAGIALGALLAWPNWTAKATAWIALGALAIMSLEVALEWLGWLPPIHPVRFGLGLAFSWPIAAAGARLLHQPLNRVDTRSRPG